MPSALATAESVREPPVKLPADERHVSQRQALDDTFSGVWADMLPMRARWWTLGGAIMPNRPRWCSDETEVSGRSPPSYSTMLDSTATRSARTLAAGLSSQLSNPYTKWFGLTTTDLKLDRQELISRWLSGTVDRILAVMDRSNYYAAAEQVYMDAGVFATGAMSIEADRKTVIRCMPHAIGSYAIGQNARGRVNMFARQWNATAFQVVEEFGLTDAIPPTLRLALKNRDRRSAWKVRHLIYPNQGASDEYASVDQTRMAYRECYWLALTEPESRFMPLFESYYGEFPVAAPRWGPLSMTELWGTWAPGFIALPDVLMLYEMRLQYINSLQLGCDPTYTAGASFRNRKVMRRPGQVNVDDVSQGESSLRVLNSGNVPYQYVSAEMDLVRRQIEDCFYVPVILPMLTRLQNEAQQPTATQAGFARDEQYGMTGPIVEKFADEFHDPSIDRIFGIMWRAGMIETPPQELRGRPLRVVLKSKMAQAQQAVGVAALERHLQFSGAVASMWGQNALDSTNPDKLIQLYDEKIGLDPEVRRLDQERDAIRAQRVRAQQQAAAAQAAPMVAKAAKDLSAAKPAPDNALGQVQAALQNQTASTPGTTP